jgi:hypothetical protein
LTSGVDNHHTVDDCTPSNACSSTDDNLFRAVRQSGGTARSYVEGANAPCTEGSNAARHIPALYYRGAYSDASGSHTDTDFCTAEVRPFAELDPNALPTLSFVTPDLCHDGHDCPNADVDRFMRDTLTALIGGASYQAGHTAIFVLYDETQPTPNLVVAPSAAPGPRPGPGSHAAALRTIMSMLGLAPFAPVSEAPDLRASAPL